MAGAGGAPLAALAFLQPVAMGVLLAQGCHVYGEVFSHGSPLGLGLCSGGVLLGLLASLFHCARAAPAGQAALRRASLFWMSCTLSGGLAAVAQLRHRLGRLHASEGALAVNSFLSSGLLGASLPHVFCRITGQPEAEVVLPCVLAALVTEAVCSSEALSILRVGVSTFLLAAGVQGLATDPSIGPLRDAAGASAGFSQSRDASKSVADAGGSSSKEPFFPATVLESHRYSPHFLLGQRLRCVPKHTSAVPLVSLVARQASTEPSRSSGARSGQRQARNQRSRAQDAIGNPFPLSGDTQLDNPHQPSLPSQTPLAEASSTSTAASQDGRQQLPAQGPPAEVLKQRGITNAAGVGSDIRWEVILEEMQRVDGSRGGGDGDVGEVAREEDGPVEVFADLAGELEEGEAVEVPAAGGEEEQEEQDERDVEQDRACQQEEEGNEEAQTQQQEEEEEEEEEEDDEQLEVVRADVQDDDANDDVDNELDNDNNDNDDNADHADNDHNDDNGDNDDLQEISADVCWDASPDPYDPCDDDDDPAADPALPLAPARSRVLQSLPLASGRTKTESDVHNSSKEDLDLGLDDEYDVPWLEKQAPMPVELESGDEGDTTGTDPRQRRGQRQRRWDSERVRPDRPSPPAGLPLLGLGPGPGLGLGLGLGVGVAASQETSPRDGDALPLSLSSLSAAAVEFVPSVGDAGGLRQELRADAKAFCPGDGLVAGAAAGIGATGTSVAGEMVQVDPAAQGQSFGVPLFSDSCGGAMADPSGEQLFQEQAGEQLYHESVGDQQLFPESHGTVPNQGHHGGNSGAGEMLQTEDGWSQPFGSDWGPQSDPKDVYSFGMAGWEDGYSAYAQEAAPEGEWDAYGNYCGTGAVAAGDFSYEDAAGFGGGQSYLSAQAAEFVPSGWGVREGEEASLADHSAVNGPAPMEGGCLPMAEEAAPVESLMDPELPDPGLGRASAVRRGDGTDGNHVARVDAGGAGGSWNRGERGVTGKGRNGWGSATSRWEGQRGQVKGQGQSGWDEEAVCWAYVDPNDQVQVGFKGSEMRKWYEQGYFDGDLLVARVQCPAARAKWAQTPSRRDFYPLRQWFPDPTRSFIS